MNLGIDLCGVALKNPVMTASGTFGSGEEYSEFVDLNKLGAVVTKGVANVPWEGNPTPRVAEVYGGMLNAIGLQNPGIDLFIDRDIPFLKKYDTKIIVNVCGHTTEEYIDVVERLSDQPVDVLEINISCPNVKEGGIAFGQNPKMVEEVTKEMKGHAKQPVIMKLSPNVTAVRSIFLSQLRLSPIFWLHFYRRLRNWTFCPVSFSWWRSSRCLFFVWSMCSASGRRIFYIRECANAAPDCALWCLLTAWWTF